MYTFFKFSDLTQHKNTSLKFNIWYLWGVSCDCTSRQGSPAAQLSAAPSLAGVGAERRKAYICITNWKMSFEPTSWDLINSMKLHLGTTELLEPGMDLALIPCSPTPLRPTPILFILERVTFNSYLVQLCFDHSCPKAQVKVMCQPSAGVEQLLRRLHSYNQKVHYEYLHYWLANLCYDIFIANSPESLSHNCIFLSSQYL